METISRPAFGKLAVLGEAYDARTDRIIDGTSLIGNKHPFDLFNTKDIHQAAIEYSKANFMSERYQALDVNGEAALSVLTDIAKVEGSSAYLRERLPGDNFLCYNITCKATTYIDRLNFEYQDLPKLISPDPLKNKDTTHVIVGIEYGCNLIMSISIDCTTEVDLNEADERISRKIRGLVDRLRSRNFESFDWEMSNPIHIELYSDDEKLLVKSDNMMNRCLHAFQESCRVYEAPTDARGQSIKLHLMKIEDFAKKLNFVAEKPENFGLLSRSPIDQLIHLLNESTENFARIRALWEQIDAVREMLTKKSKKTIRDRYELCKTRHEQAIATVRDSLLMIRSGSRDHRDNLFDILTQLKDSPNSNHSIQRFFEENRESVREIRFHSRFGAYQVRFVKTAEEFEALKDGLQANVLMVVLFYSLSNIKDSNEWRKTQHLYECILYNYRQKTIDLLALAVNYDDQKMAQLQLDEGLPSGLRIVGYEDGEYKTKDYVGHLEMVGRSNFVAYKDEPKAWDKGPLELRRAEISCPNAACGSETRIWICARCYAELEYDGIRNFYCECGTCDMMSYRYSCCSDTHERSIDAEWASEEDLINELADLKPYEHFNILVVGDTGVGKSTWINSTATYILHRDLQTASQAKFSYLIPFQFRDVRQNGNQDGWIRYGNSKNEVVVPGQSCTQKTKAHRFKHHEDKRIYCIIDTPGSNDTNHQRNQANIKNILEFLGDFSEINLICVLVEANKTNLSAAFENAFETLMTSLHPSAAQNVAFCFTKASDIEIRMHACQAMGLLRSLLTRIHEKHRLSIPEPGRNSFIFNNIAFQYLATLNYTKHEESDSNLLSLYTGAYNHSADETRRMLDEAQMKEPHSVKESLRYNYARKIIKRSLNNLTMIAVAMSRSLEEMTRVQVVALQDCQGNPKEIVKLLGKKPILYRYRVSVVRGAICRRCAREQELSGEKRRRFLETHLYRVDEDPIKVYEGGKCELKDGSYQCPRCGKDFERVDWGQDNGRIKEDFLEMSRDLKKKRAESQTDKDESKLLIEIRQDEKRKLQDEFDSLKRALILFSVFLHQNSPNDGDLVAKLLDALINEEEGTLGSSNHQSLTSLLNEYKQGKEGFKDQINSETILNTLIDLIKLKYYGKDVAQMIEIAKERMEEKNDGDPQSVFLVSSHVSMRDRFGKILRNIYASARHQKEAFSAENLLKDLKSMMIENSRFFGTQGDRRKLEISDPFDFRRGDDYETILEKMKEITRGPDSEAASSSKI